MSLSTMPAYRRKARLAAVFAAVLGLATATVTTVPGAAALPGPPGCAAATATDPHPKSDQDLGDADRARLAAAQAAGKKTVTLLVAAERDRLSAAADQLRALGGVCPHALGWIGTGAQRGAGRQRPGRDRDVLRGPAASASGHPDSS